MFARVTPARMVRLCLKELRESLRDRRTIVTLVLMPLLVYPLLSLILNRVLLTSLEAKTEQTLTIGIGQDLKDSALPSILQMGLGLLYEPTLAPVFLEPAIQDQQLPGAERDSKQSESPLPKPVLVTLADNGRTALRNNSVDLVLVGKVGKDEDELTGGVANLAMKQIVDQLKASGSMPPEFDPQAFLEVVGNYDVRYRQGDPQSERALQVVERILAAVNNQAARELTGMRFEVPFRLAATPVVMQSNYADLLATMVPLVLVLMTMAGAVYPAIDLTAGERERGTMEALIVAPIPSSLLLLAKYAAVVVVALLTALANLAAMTITLWVSGIGKLIFGDGILSAGVIGTILALLVLFTMFFAALLLAVTSFAKSFKEAQAYLIPLMLLALTPGVMSLLPGIEFSGLLATVPLVNIVLLARQVLLGGAEWNTAMVAVICNGIYALAALAVASRLFGSDASMHGSQGSWRDLLIRPIEKLRLPGLDQMAMTMAIMFPLYFIISSTLPSTAERLDTRLWISAIVSFMLLLVFPLLVCWYRRIRIATTFRLHTGSIQQWLFWVPAVLAIGASAWMFAHEIFIAAQWLGVGTIGLEKMAEVLDFKQQLQRLPLWSVLCVFALTPAICEELLFRGFVLSSLHRSSAFWAVVWSAVLFGLMHVLTSNVLAVERFLPSAFMGLILGWIAIRSGSIWPGVLLHALHNGLLLTMTYYQERLDAMNLFVNEGTHLPTSWLLGGGIAFAIGLITFWLSSRSQTQLVKPEMTPPLEQPA